MTNLHRWFFRGVVALCGVASAAVAAEPTVSSKAFVGEPFGVGEVVIEYPVDSPPVWHGDRGPRIQSLGAPVHYPAWIAEYSKSPELQTLRILFLFQGEQPRMVEVHAAGIVSTRLTPLQDADARTQLLKKWWTTYNKATPLQLDSGPATQVKNYLRSMLSRRLNQPRPAQEAAPSSLDQLPLDRFLNDSLGLLIGSTSIRTALQNERMLALPSAVETANLPLPQATSPPAIPLPEKLKPETVVEDIAFHTPAECFYVRCQRFSDYLWLRDLIDAWGGTVDNLVAQESFDCGLRRRVERRLALSPNEEARAVLSDAVSDFAVIGTDLFFRDGPSVGVLFEAKKDREVAAVIRGQRDLIRAELGARETEVQFGNHRAKLLTTADGSVRSFYAVAGKYHLVTTSEWITRRFFECQQGTGSLGGLDEFRYARQKMPVSRNDQAFIYLSDPFFRTLVGPKYRVEMTRRAASLADLQLLELARLAAAGEGRKLSSVKELRDAGFLPQGFGARADGSSAEIVAGHVRDSLRGATGAFLPIPDVQITGITTSEAHGYQDFAREYQQQWRQMDPVTVAIARKPGAAGREVVSLDFVITPYAVSHYGFMASYLSASKQRVSAGQDMLAVMEATTAIPWFDGLTIFAGVKDLAIPVEIKRGQLVPHSVVHSFSDFLKGWKQPFVGFAAKDPQRMEEVLAMLNALAELQHDKPDVNGYIQIKPKEPGRPSFYLDLIRAGRLQKQHAVYGLERADLEAITPDLKLVDAERPAQIRLRVGDLRDTNFARAADAAGYLGARHLSAVNSQLMWQFDQQLRVSPGQIPAAATGVFGGRPLCPLGGQYQLGDGKLNPSLWSSTAWETKSIQQVNRVPPGYRYPFTTWLHELSIDFNISRTTLSTHLELTLHP
ncbi:hypothetical protein NA78x_000815 [Anatilimnocola sp. NA78]|uniref:hypothetical protein n=1 Tax=Anatilimnocola sp. NA78 TaxID=3415683 RepID=UPI003CE59B45